MSQLAAQAFQPQLGFSTSPSPGQAAPPTPTSTDAAQQTQSNLAIDTMLIGTGMYFTRSKPEKTAPQSDSSQARPTSAIDQPTPAPKPHTVPARAHAQPSTRSQPAAPAPAPLQARSPSTYVGSTLPRTSRYAAPVAAPLHPPQTRPLIPSATRRDTPQVASQPPSQRKTCVL